MQSYYNIIDHIPYAVLYIPMSYLFYNWKLVSLNLFHLFRLPLTPLPSSNHQFDLCVYESVSVLFYLFLCFVF